MKKLDTDNVIQAELKKDHCSKQYLKKRKSLKITSRSVAMVRV